MVLLKKTSFIFFPLFLSCHWAAFAQEPLTLKAAYELSLKVSEDIASKAELIREAQGHFTQALSGILPKAEYVITRQEQDADRSAADSGSNSNLLRKTTPQQKFVLSQPLFSGFKEFAAMQGAGLEKSQRMHEKKRAEELLFIDVMEAYYGLLQAREDLGLLDRIQTVLHDRIGQLDERVRLGRSRESEIKTALVDLKLAEVDKEDLRQAEIVWRRLLEFYIGRPLTGALRDDDIPAVQDPAALDSPLQTKERPDVLAAKEAYRVSDKKVGIATGGLLPSAKLDGNYYTQRVGTQSGIDWDVLLTVNVPIFEGTSVIGDIQSAAANRGVAKLAWSKAERLAAVEAADAYDAFQASLRQEKALWEAKQAAEENAAIQSEEYQNQLVNNLDVLQALHFQEDTSRRWNQAHYQTKKNYWRYKIAVGMGIEPPVVSKVEP